MIIRSLHRNAPAARRGLASLVVVATLGATGCQGMYNGQTLPSPYYRQDDVQYFAPGPEFKLANEAAAMAEAKAAIESEPQQ
jgi:hypothetical protein